MSDSKLSAGDKLAIHEVINRSAWSYDAARLDVLGDCFADDAKMSFRIAGGDSIGPYVGREAIVKLIRDSLDSQNDQRRHVISNVFFECEEMDGAVALSNLTLLAVAEGEVRVLTTGIYRDVFVLQSGTWQIRERFLELDLPY
jgi:hypothetical protein